MKKYKNFIIIILVIAFFVIMIYGLKTWNNAGKEMASKEPPTTSVPVPSVINSKNSVPEIKITSDNNFMTGNITNTAVTVSIVSNDLKDIYVNGVSLGKSNEALLETPGSYEIIAENNDGVKSILKFNIDPVASMPTVGIIKSEAIKSEPYTGPITSPGPVIETQSPENLVDGGTISAELVTLAYSSENEIASVTLDGEKMEIVGTVTSYVPGKHVVVVADAKGNSTTFTFTNNY
ncbi:MAG: hypothetical protein RR310_05085 [Eubacterium sp.]